VVCLVADGILLTKTHVRCAEPPFSLEREDVKHRLNCECAMEARPIRLYDKSLKIYIIL